MEKYTNKNGARGLSEQSDSSILVPGDKIVNLSRSQLEHQIKLLQQKLAATRDFIQRTIAVVLPNSIELVSIFLAITRKRGIAALLNPSNKENEFQFYMDDIDPAMVIVSKGAYDANSDSVKAAKKHGCGIAECYWDGQDVVMDVIVPVQNERTNGERAGFVNIEPLDNDIALLLRTSGTTGRPRAVSFLFLFLRCWVEVWLPGSIDPQEP